MMFIVKMARPVIDLATILIVIPFQVFGQTVSTTGISVVSTTDPTCGSGNINCSTYGTPTSTVELPTTSKIYSQQTTASSPATEEEITVSPSALPSENFTSKHELEMTTKGQRKTISSTITPPTVSPVPHQPLQQPALGFDNSGICACDVKLNSCDVNCCCDQECSPFQRTSFSHCQVEGYPPYDNRYCYASKLIFLNNSEHVLQQTQNGAFCIVRSNLAGSILYPSHAAIINHQEFSKYWIRTHSSFWPEPSSEMLLPTDNPKPYKAGSPIWILKNRQIHPLELPVSGLSTSCSTMKRVSYLLPLLSHCARRVPTTSEDCDKISIGFIHHLKGIVQSPEAINLTTIIEAKNESCPDNICSPVKFFSCSGSSLEEPSAESCKNISGTLFGYKSGICHGAMKKLKVVVYHNGTAGIKYVEAYMWMQNITVVKQLSTQSLQQSFSVEFNWITQNITADINNTVSSAKTFTFSRSGNRGYIVGKPVIAGLRQTPNVNISKDETKESRGSIRYDVIELSPYSKQWITLPKANFQGMCDLTMNQRHIVTFGEDLHVSCGVVISPKNVSSQSLCNGLKIRLLNLLLGDVGQPFQNTSFISDWRRMIAMFGSANVSNPEEWIPFLLDGQAPVSTPSSDDEKQATGDGDNTQKMCENVPLGIQIRIMHGLIGNSLKPQSKIFGAALKFSSFQDIGWTCPASTCFQGQKTLYLRIVSTVKFIDVTSPAVTRFAEPPAIHIRLPPDFFYPFMSIDNSAFLILHNLPLLLSALLFEFVMYFVWFGDF